jgi:hypothetical protein
MHAGIRDPHSRPRCAHHSYEIAVSHTSIGFVGGWGEEEEEEEEEVSAGFCTWTTLDTRTHNINIENKLSGHTEACRRESITDSQEVGSVRSERII